MPPASRLGGQLSQVTTALGQMRANRGHLDLAEVREYFELFNRGSLLDELLRQTS